MSMKTLELAILQELRDVTKDQHLRLKDIIAWTTAPNMESAEGEGFAWLPVLKISVAFRPRKKAE